MLWGILIKLNALFSFQSQNVSKRLSSHRHTITANATSAKTTSRVSSAEPSRCRQISSGTSSGTCSRTRRKVSPRSRTCLWSRRSIRSSWRRHSTRPAASSAANCVSSCRCTRAPRRPSPASVPTSVSNWSARSWLSVRLWLWPASCRSARSATWQASSWCTLWNCRFARSTSSTSMSSSWASGRRQTMKMQ